MLERAVIWLEHENERISTSIGGVLIRLVACLGGKLEWMSVRSVAGGLGPRAASHLLIGESRAHG